MLIDFIYFIRFEIRMMWRTAYTTLTPLLFFLIIICLFPLGLGSDDALLKMAAPSIIWVSALLATLLSVHHLFRDDAEEGFIDNLLLSAQPLTLLIIAKLVSHWLVYTLPLILITPLLGILLHLSQIEINALILSLLLGTPILLMLGAIGAALTVGIRNSGLLLPILIMPLYVPVLIFGTSTVASAGLHQSIHAELAILAAFNLLTLAFAPLFTAMALRIGVNQ